MTCPTEFDELMSLKLDGLIDEHDDRRLDEHLRTCDPCGVLWAAMKQADSLLWTSALEPLPVPANFQVKVMSQIAPSMAANAAVAIDPLFQPASGMVGTMPLILPAGATRRLEQSPTSYLSGYGEWQKRVATYVRGMAAVGISLAGTIGLLLALMMSGTIKVSGPLADVVSTIRTFFQAIDTWVRSLFVSFGPGAMAVGLVMIGILALVGWQVVSGYHHTALEYKGNTGALEAVA